jgi:transcriptional regulator with XRE-family HTH domain
MRDWMDRLIRGGSCPCDIRELDLYVGARLRERRIMLGLTQIELARLIGVTCQQLHKYERGHDRITAGQLFKLAAALNVHFGYFYETPVEPSVPAYSQRLLLDFTRAVLAIPDPKQRDALCEFARRLANADRAEDVPNAPTAI